MAALYRHGVGWRAEGAGTLDRWQRQLGQDWWYGLKQDGVTLIPYSDLVPDAVREKVKEKGRDMMHGKFRVFTGMSDEDLRNMATLDSNVVSGGP